MDLRHDSTYHHLCYTSCGALVNDKSSTGPPGDDLMIHRSSSGCSTTSYILFLQEMEGVV